MVKEKKSHLEFSHQKSWCKKCGFWLFLSCHSEMFSADYVWPLQVSINLLSTKFLMIPVWNAQAQKCNMMVGSCWGAWDPTVSLYSGPIPYKEAFQMLWILLTTVLGMDPRQSHCSKDGSTADVHSNLSDQQGQKSTQTTFHQEGWGVTARLL